MYCYNCMNNKGAEELCPFCHRAHDREVPSHHLRPGTVLNRKYLVGYAIGEGGFGITYIGRDMTLDVRVAIKEFYPTGYTNRNSYKESSVVVGGEKQKQFFDKGKERFLFEARSVAKFSSEKGIVDVRDFFEANGTAYIIMEYLEGMDLSHWLETYGVIPAEQAFSLMLPVMRSLEKINAAGIIHRDISPDNIMYLNDGTLKLMDFGSARYFQNEEKEMSVMLKQGFAPEEQYRKNGRQGPWTDVYGLCATIYCCITGVVPQSGVDRAHRDTLRPPSQLGVAIPSALERVLMYGLAVFADQRCRDMNELIRLTQQALSQQPVDTPVGYVPDRARSDKRVTYGDEFSTIQKGESTKEFDPAEKKLPPIKPEKQYSRTIPIVLVSIAAVLLVAMALLFILYGDRLFGVGGDDPTAATGAVIQTEADVTQPGSAATAPTKDERIKVPDVGGMSLEDAVVRLNALGLRYEFRFIPSTKVKQNHVISQSPAADTYAEPGDTVILTLAEAVDITEPSAQPSTDNPNTYFCIATNIVYLHERADRRSQWVDQIQQGESVILVANDGTFMQVIYNGQKGYVLSKYFSRDSSDTPNEDIEYLQEKICILDTYCNVMPEQTTIVIPISVGDEVTLVGLLADSGYYELIYRGQPVYMPVGEFEGAFISSVIE